MFLDELFQKELYCYLQETWSVKQYTVVEVCKFSIQLFNNKVTLALQLVIVEQKSPRIFSELWNIINSL